MDELVAAGEARQLFPEFDIGPVFFERMWWVVPQGAGELERGYTVAEDDDQVELTALFLTLERSAEVVAQAEEQHRVDVERWHSDDPAWPYERDARQKKGSRSRWWRR